MGKKKKEIILIGAGGHAESCIDLLNEQNRFSLKEVIGKKKELKKKLLGQYTVKYDDSELRYLIKKYSFALIGVGQINKKNPRIKIFKLLKKLKFLSQKFFLNTQLYQNIQQSVKGRSLCTVQLLEQKLK